MPASDFRGEPRPKPPPTKPPPKTVPASLLPPPDEMAADAVCAAQRLVHGVERDNVRLSRRDMALCREVLGRAALGEPPEWASVERLYHLSRLHLSPAA